MRAAIYARKTTDQRDVGDEQKSVTTQITGARAFILKQPTWTLEEHHIYQDDGLSGVLYTGRPGFQRMLLAAQAGAFDALVLFDLDRFGRDNLENLSQLKELQKWGVTVWDFSSGRMVDLDSMGGRAMVFMTGEGAQAYREQVRKHTKSKMYSKAVRGEVTGGLVFGYRNVRPSGPKGPAFREIYEPEAAVVRDIFRRYAAGEGARTIAAALNAERVPTPRAQRGRMPGWSASTVREVLKRPLYHGVIVYGRSTALYRHEIAEHLMKQGKPRPKFKEKAQLPTDPTTWITLPINEALRIIDPNLAERAEALRLARRRRYQASLGIAGARMPERATGKYLLSGGMLICPTCKGHFEAIRYPRAEYVCATRRRKPGTCSNTLRLPIDYADEVVLDMVEGEVLGRKYIEELLAVAGHVEEDNTGMLTKERDRLRGEIERLVDSVASGVPADSIAPGIREREAQIARLEVKLRQPRKIAPNIEALREALTLRAAEWRQTLRTEPKVARLLLRKLIGPLELVDESQRPDWIDADTAKKPALLESELTRCGSSVGDAIARERPGPVRSGAERLTRGPRTALRACLSAARV